MTGYQEGVSDRYSAPQLDNDFVASIDRLGESLVQIGVSVLTLPAVLLPSDMRDDVRTTTTDLLSGIARLHRNITLVTIASIGSLARAASQAAEEVTKTETIDISTGEVKTTPSSIS